MRTDFAKPYNWTTNRVDENSEDFKNVVKWLQDHGAPAPQVLMIQLDPTGWVDPRSGTFPGSVMFLTFVGDPLPHDAAQVMNSPGVVLKELGLVSGDINYTPPAAPKPQPVPISTHVGPRICGDYYAQLEPETDPESTKEVNDWPSPILRPQSKPTLRLIVQIAVGVVASWLVMIGFLAVCL